MLLHGVRIQREPLRADFAVVLPLLVLLKRQLLRTLKMSLVWGRNFLDVRLTTALLACLHRVRLLFD